MGIWGSKDFETENGMIIHYFLMNNGFEYTPSDSVVDGVHISYTPPTYKKKDTTVCFDESARIFIIQRAGEVIFQIDNKGESLPVTDNDGNVILSDWTIQSAGNEITMDDVMHFFREDKLKDLFKDV